MRRVFLAGGFLIAFLALVGVWYWRTHGAVAVHSFAQCARLGFVVSGGAENVCTLPDGTVFRPDDRVAFVDVALPFSFSYPGAYDDVRGRIPNVLSLAHSGSTLRMQLVSASKSPEQVIRTTEGFLTGSLTIIRSLVNGHDEVIVGLQPKHAVADRSIVVIPLRPPVSSLAHVYDFAVLTGSGRLLEGVVASLAFSEPSAATPRSYLPTSPTAASGAKKE